MIYIVRHGQTDGNKNMILMGQQDWDLNETGRNQAEQFGLQQIQGKHFDVALTSTLLRASNTLDISFKAGNVSVGQIIKHDGLKERKYGDAEGITVTKEDWAKFWVKDSEIKIPNAETIADVEKRALKMTQFISQFKGKNIILYSHGDFIRVFVSVLYDNHLKISDYSKVQGIENCELVSFDWSLLSKQDITFDIEP
ncbi:MAG: histidine phosphatase family protein [Firmicutes bacterium]|nr:histidine phosphatase family protein [Bacillota bacterium]